MSDDPKFFLCECTTHAIAVKPFNIDELPDVKWDELEITIWQHPPCISLIDKLKWCWEIIRWGCPYGDFAILRKEKIIELRDYLNEVLEGFEK